MARKTMTQDEFITKANAQHSNRYGYDNVVYVGSTKKVTVTCHKHGDFDIRAATHIAGQGCRKCGYDSHRVSQDEFIKRAIDKHGNAYKYDRVKLVSMSDKVLIGCKLHGYFPQTAETHIVGAGCPRCKVDYISCLLKSYTKEWIKKAKAIHGDVYDYSKVQYNRCADHVTIICKKHGDFEQVANSHLSGSGCFKCSRERRFKK